MVNYSKDLEQLGMRGISCYGCGIDLGPEDRVLACSDCGAIFCETCVRNGAPDDHHCEPEEGEW